MRDPKRIKPFMEEIGKIWEEECPDQRFGQMICNVFDSMGRLAFYTEDEDMLDKFKKYFNRDKKGGNNNGKNRNNKSVK